MHGTGWGGVRALSIEGTQKRRRPEDTTGGRRGGGGRVTWGKSKVATIRRAYDINVTIGTYFSVLLDCDRVMNHHHPTMSMP